MEEQNENTIDVVSGPGELAASGGFEDPIFESPPVDYPYEMPEVPPLELSPPTQIAYTALDGHTVIVRGTAGITADDLAGGLPEGTAWREVSAEEADALSCAKTLDQAKDEKLNEIIAGANAMSATIKAKYSQPEIDSWQQQESEARALLADADAPGQLVRKLAANAGVTPLEFAGRIVGNAEAAAAATEAIILQQQAMEKAVKEAGSVEAVLAVTVDYCLG